MHLPEGGIATTTQPVAAKVAKIPYLDGLRAWSIVLVIMGHSLPTNSWLKANWYLQPLLSNLVLGPRVFFVISGFLITTLLLEEKNANGRISISGFYKRRVARIFPVFYLYILIIGILTAVHVMDVPLSSFYAASTFTYNFHPLWRHGGTPDLSQVLGHFWTLSVEEQFYLIWPSLLVFAGRRWSQRIAAASVVCLPLLRLGIYLLLPPGKVQVDLEAFAIQDMIMWGALGAFAVREGLLDRMRTHRFRWSYPLISGFLLFVVGGALWLQPRYGLDSYLLPSMQAGATLLLIFWLLSGEGGTLRRGLESWPMVQLGLLSYSLYIWQQPFTLWSGMEWLRFPWNALLPLAVAIASYRLVEVPMRSLIRRWFSQTKPRVEISPDAVAH